MVAVTETATAALEQAQALVDTLQAQAKAGERVTRTGDAVVSAQANLDASQAAVRAVAEVFDVQVLTRGEADASQIPEREVRTNVYPNDVALSVVRLAVKHETVPVAGTWHTSQECA
jgi:hypothetical protein